MTDGQATSLELQAGSLTCVLDGADVRDLEVGGQRILTRLYIAVRDEKWNTIPFRCARPFVETDSEHFNVTLSCAVDRASIRVQWDVSIAGSASGEFRYSMRGRALNSFRYAKLGLNLHHPLPESLGARYVARCRGESATGRIPSLIDPQLFIDERLTAMFMPFEELALQTAADDEVVFRFAGEEFEMQDHRNWTDYNLKSYGTPLAVPLPLIAEVNQAFEQSVVVDLRGSRGLRHPPIRSKAGAEPLAVDRTRIAKLPRIGSEFPDEVSSLGDQAARLVEAAELDYVRLNLDLTSDINCAASAVKARQVRTWGLPLELVLVVSLGEALADELARLGSWLDDLRPRLERVVVLEAPRGFFIGRTTTSGAKVRSYREVIEAACGPTALVSATEQFFADLNRLWPDLSGVDGVGYSICPQVHAADDISLMENSWGQADTVATARAQSGGRPVHVIAVEMIGKFGPYPGGIPSVPVLSAYGDQRQHQTFGAAWTVSSIRQLVDAEAVSVTYFELAGERGLIRPAADDSGTTAKPGPVYRVLEAVSTWKQGNVVRIGTIHGALVGLGFEWPERAELLVANLSPSEQRVQLSGLSGRVMDVRVLRNGNASTGAEWVQTAARHAESEQAGYTEFGIGRYGVALVRTS